MTWGSIGGAAVSVVGGALLGGHGGGGGGGSPNYYMPGGLQMADQMWQGAADMEQGYAGIGDRLTLPSYYNTYNAMGNIDYSGYQQRQGQSGDAYGAVGDAAMGQMGQYGQRAAGSAGQQDMMYGAAGGAIGVGQHALTAIPGMDQAYAQMGNVDYSGYQRGADQAGQVYGQAGNAAVAQMGQFGQRASADATQADAMFGDARQILNTANDPQNQLYGRTAQRLQDQVRSGQAARGIGTSDVGLKEEADAMSNFNIDWENAQLGRQATGAQAAGAATASGLQANQQFGADQSAVLASGQAGGDFYGQASQVPLSAREYVAGAPGRNATSFAQGMGEVAGVYGQGVQAGAGATNAGVNAGRMWGSDMSAGLAAGAEGAGYYGQAGQVPLAGQEYVAGAGARQGSTLAAGLNSVGQMWGNVGSMTIPYMNYGQGAQQSNWNNQYQSNRDMAGALGQMGQAFVPKAVDWWNGTSSAPQQSWDPTQYSSPGGGDSYYGSGQNWGI